MFDSPDSRTAIFISSFYETQCKTKSGHWSAESRAGRSEKLKLALQHISETVDIADHVIVEGLELFRSSVIPVT